MSNTPADRIVWIDCEMTGLDVERDGLCEIAIVITDFDLQPVDTGMSIVIHPGDAALEQMDDFVRSMHRDSGLLDEIPHGVSAEEAEHRAIEYVNRHVGAGRRPLVGGNTIGMDRRFISKFLPAFDARLHYRSLDVSTLKELARRWYPSAFHSAPEKRGGHRALADIVESIRELDYFRRTILATPPGPSTSEAKRASSAAAERFSKPLDG